MRILVIGDHCIDKYIIGKADRLSPEAPCPVLVQKRSTLNEGMAGNVYQNVKSLAPEATVKLICQDNLIVKTRYVDDTSGYILLRVDEDDQVKKELTVENFISSIGGETFDIILISDYNKGFLSAEAISVLVDYFRCQRPQPIVFLDTKKILGVWSRFVDFVKINEKEYKQQLAANERPQDFCIDLIVTKGGAGSTYINDNVTVPSEKIEVRDVSGAGDTYFAAFAIKLFETRDILAAMEYANKASAVAVSKHGVVAVQKSEIT